MLNACKTKQPLNSSALSGQNLHPALWPCSAKRPIDRDMDNKLDKNISADIAVIETDASAREHLQAFLQGQGLDIPVLAAAPEDQDTKAIYLLDSADACPPDIPQKDCLIKPFRIGALLDRINLYIAASEGLRSTKPMTIGDFIFDPLSRALKKSAAPQTEVSTLTDKECAILQALGEDPGEVVSRRFLLKSVWGYNEDIETHTLETHIYRLRQKIERDPGKPEILITHEDGYYLRRQT